MCPDVMRGFRSLVFGGLLISAMYYIRDYAPPAYLPPSESSTASASASISRNPQPSLAPSIRLCPDRFAGNLFRQVQELLDPQVPLPRHCIRAHSSHPAGPRRKNPKIRPTSQFQFTFLERIQVLYAVQHDVAPCDVHV